MSSERAPRVRIPPPLVGLVALLAGVALQKLAFPLPLGLESPGARIGGALIFALAGLLFLLMAFRHFRRTGQDPAPWTPAPELILGGIYRRTRNPMYIGLALIQVGLGLFFDNLWIVLMVLPALAIIDRTAVRPEEIYLERKFGDQYRRYRDSVRRWL